MTKLKLTEGELAEIIKKIIVEDYSDNINIVNKNAEYKFSYNEIYQLSGDLHKIYNFIQEIESLIPNRAEYSDKLNRVKRSIKILNKKTNY